MWGLVWTCPLNSTFHKPFAVFSEGVPVKVPIVSLSGMFLK